MTDYVRMSPCPFCSGPPVVICVDAINGGTPDDWDPDRGVTVNAYVFCHECGAQGPVTVDALIFTHEEMEPQKANAVRFWNDRDLRNSKLYAHGDREGLNTFPRRADS